jgi:16S rRNA (cytidine1402-2'-O)-methyltransferase
MLVSDVRKEFGSGIKVIPIPGPSALVAALSASGVSSSTFTFLGFIPHKKGRETLFKRIASSDEVMVFYESTHRILKTLESLDNHSPTFKVVIGRELTKEFEQFVEGTAKEVLEYFNDHPDKQRGEFVVIVVPK